MGLTTHPSRIRLSMRLIESVLIESVYLVYLLVDCRATHQAMVLPKRDHWVKDALIPPIS